MEDKRDNRLPVYFTKAERIEVQGACKECPGEVSESSFVARAAVEKARMIRALSGDGSSDNMKNRLQQVLRFLTGE